MKRHSDLQKSLKKLISTERIWLIHTVMMISIILWTTKHSICFDIAKSEIEEQMKFVKENDVCKVMSYKGNVFGVEPPTFVELEVVDTEPGFAGNTSTNATKPATLETGATIQVPLFVDMNEVIRVDTRTGEYMERVK